jgi:Peptidase A4 family
MPTIKLPHGSTVRTFAPLAPGFKPLEADDRQLLLHGFPPRPVEDPKLLKHWEKTLSRPLHIIQPQFRAMDHKRHHLRESMADRHATETSRTWSGVVAFAPQGTTMQWVNGTWNVPNAFPPGGAQDGVWYSASTWVGIDGAGDGARDVLQAGCDSDVMLSGGVIQRQLMPWWEWYPGGTIGLSNFPVVQGDTLNCSICVDEGSTTAARIYLYNVTSGVATSFAATAPSGGSLQGNCAEWIVEAIQIDIFDAEVASYGDVYFAGAGAGTVRGDFVNAGSGDTINMLDFNGKVVSYGDIEGTTLVGARYSGPNP